MRWLENKKSPMIPVQTYHALSTGDARDRYVVKASDFEKDMEYVCSEGYEGISVEEYFRGVDVGFIGMGGRKVVITFDDGHVSNFEIALPILKKNGLRASFFITTDWIGRAGYMDEEQIGILKQEGMSIQSHGKTHRFLSGISDEEVYWELEESKRALEAIVADAVRFVSFPGGRYDKRTVECAKKLGYLGVFSSCPFYIEDMGSTYLIGRTMVKNSGKGTNFLRNLNQDIIGRLRLRSAYISKRGLTRVIGDDRYSWIWQRYSKRK